MSFADYGFAIWETFYVTILSTAFLCSGCRWRLLWLADEGQVSVPCLGPGVMAHSVTSIINIHASRAVPAFD